MQKEDMVQLKQEEWHVSLSHGLVCIIKPLSTGLTTSMQKGDMMQLKQDKWHLTLCHGLMCL